MIDWVFNLDNSNLFTYIWKSLDQKFCMLPFTLECVLSLPRWASFCDGEVAMLQSSLHPGDEVSLSHSSEILLFVFRDSLPFGPFQPKDGNSLQIVMIKDIDSKGSNVGSSSSVVEVYLKVLLSVCDPHQSSCGQMMSIHVCIFNAFICDQFYKHS